MNVAVTDDSDFKFDLIALYDGPNDGDYLPTALMLPKADYGIMCSPRGIEL